MNRRSFLKSLSIAGGAAAVLPSDTWATITATMKPDRPVHNKILVAHRGASSYAPENTIPAYMLAIKQGADLVEQDLNITKDGILVCIHDVSLEATTNIEDVFPDRFEEKTVGGKMVKTWPIHKFTMAEIKQLKAGSRTDGQFPATTIPTWQEAIDAIRGKAGLCPEIKSLPEYKKLGFDMEKMVADTLRKNGLDKRGADPNTPIVMQCFHHDRMLALRKNGIDLPELWLRSKRVKDVMGDIKTAKKLKFEWIGPYKTDATKEFVDAAHAAGIKVMPYTFRPADKAEGFTDLRAEMAHYLYDNGIDALFTDNPDMFPRR